MYSGYGSAASTQPQGKVSPVKEVSQNSTLKIPSEKLILSVRFKLK